MMDYIVSYGMLIALVVLIGALWALTKIKTEG